MAQKEITIGVKSITIAKNAPDGTPGTNGIQIGDTYEDSLSITTEAGTEVTVNIEESDSPIYARNRGGTISIAYQIPNPDYEKLASLTGNTWSASAGYSEKENSDIGDCTVVIVPEIGKTITYNRVNVSMEIGGALGKNNALMVSVSGTVLYPLKAGVARATYK